MRLEGVSVMLLLVEALLRAARRGEEDCMSVDEREREGEIERERHEGTQNKLDYCKYQLKVHVHVCTCVHEDIIMHSFNINMKSYHT